MRVQEIIEKYRKAINAVYTEEELHKIIKDNPEFEYAIRNIIPLLNLQPERSKREDYYPKDHIWCGCPECGECKCSRCGALNSMET